MTSQVSIEGGESIMINNDSWCLSQPIQKVNMVENGVETSRTVQCMKSTPTGLFKLQIDGKIVSIAIYFQVFNP